MKKVIESVAQPIITRVGTALAAWLVAEGYNEPDVGSITLGFQAAALVALDFATRAFFKK